MARSPAKPSIKRTRWQAQGKRPQGVEKPQQPLRRSTRLQETRQKEAKFFLSSPPTTIPLEPKALHRSPPEPGTVTPSCPPPKIKRKRKRSPEGEASEIRPRVATSGNQPRADININSNEPLADTNGDQPTPRLRTWLQEGNYPEEYFKPPDGQTWEDIKADTLATRLEVDGMKDLRLARKKSAGYLRQEALEGNTDAPTEHTGDKSLPYRSPGYAAELADKGSHLWEAPEGISDESKELCQKLLTTEQAVLQDSDFHDDRFKEVCDMVRDRNEARVVEDISPLIAPSPEKLKLYGAKELEHLIFNANERWVESIPVTKTRPQPDGSVGFKRSAFTESQVLRLLPYIGDRVPINYLSLFLATWRTFFPFFAREAKGGEGDLDVADKQNAHSMTMAVRGIVELFKLVHREGELHQEILAFSISHDASMVRIYGHYALIKEREPTFWRHPIRTFDFTEQDGKEKWTAYQFTKNVYFEFMPKLHVRICSAIDQLPLKQTPFRVLSNLPQQIPLNASFGTDTGLNSEQPTSQGIAVSAPGSQNPTGSKKRKVTKALLEQENEQYQGQVYQLLEQIDLLKQQSLPKANAGRDSEVVTILRQELERQRQESKEQLERQREEMKEQMERQRQESERQRQESERQRQEMKEQMERQMQQISNLMSTLAR